MVHDHSHRKTMSHAAHDLRLGQQSPRSDWCEEVPFTRLHLPSPLPDLESATHHRWWYTMHTQAAYFLPLSRIHGGVERVSAECASVSSHLYLASKATQREYYLGTNRTYPY